VPGTLEDQKNMNTPETTARQPSTNLDLTDELPVLDVAAFEREVLSRERTGPQDCTAAAGSEASAPEAPDDPAANPAPPAVDSDYMLAVEHWIVQKTEQLRAQQVALSLAQRERNAAVARAEALSRELAEKSANIEALNDRVRILEEALSCEREAAQRRAAQLDEAQREGTRLTHELTAARAAEAQQSAALAASNALIEQRSEALETLRRAHEALSVERQRAAGELSDLGSKLRDSDARERRAQLTIAAQNRTHAELVHRVEQETGVRERLTAEREVLQAQLARCVEQLQSRESYRTLYESTAQELDAELASATLRAREQQARADQLTAELKALERPLKDAVRERDEARHSYDAAIAQHATERAESARARGALESQLAGLATEHADARARLVAMEATLTDTQRRAESEALASRTATERLRAMEAELANARLDGERDRASLADLTAAMVRSQTVLAEQSRLLEERESAARIMVADVAERAAQITALHGQIEELTARLAAPEAERRALEERVSALMGQVAESNCRVTRLDSMNVELRATVRRLHASLAERETELQQATRIASMNTYALGRVQSSIDELGRGLSASGSAPAQPQTSVLTRIDDGHNHSTVLRGWTTIGRDPDNELPLTMRSVSRRHALLIPVFRNALLQDLGSTNGVLVNQRRVRCARLEHGDVITLGKARFRYTVTPVPAGAIKTQIPRAGTASTEARARPG
jgi:FHA domain